ncbi:hypothetical protein ACUY2G_09675 [Corynebacterium guaraldiae]
MSLIAALDSKPLVVTAEGSSGWATLTGIGTPWARINGATVKTVRGKYRIEMLKDGAAPTVYGNGFANQNVTASDTVVDAGELTIYVSSNHAPCQMVITPVV